MRASGALLRWLKGRPRGGAPRTPGALAMWQFGPGSPLDLKKDAQEPLTLHEPGVAAFRGWGAIPRHIPDRGDRAARSKTA
jgi:hypothetical protein